MPGMYEEEPEWVRTEDREPDYGVDVLVVFEGEIFIDSLVDMGESGVQWNECGSPPTHWAPLPALPAKVE